MSHLGFRGYIFSRNFMGERVPQHVQNIVIRDYCTKNNLHYLLSATEYAMDDCFIIFNQLVKELSSVEGVVAYSLFQMPTDTDLRQNIFHKFIKAGKELHFAVEGLSVFDNDSCERVEDIWQVRNILPQCLSGAEL